MKGQAGTRFATRAAAGCIMAALTGCGAAPYPAASPPTASPTGAADAAPAAPAALTEGKNADEALAQLDQAEAELRRALALPAASATTLAPRAAAPAPSAAPAAAPAKEETAKTSEAAAPASADPCDTACRALASMDRAAQHLCGLAGDEDQRCEGARSRVQQASSRVHAQCPRCAGR